MCLTADWERTGVKIGRVQGSYIEKCKVVCCNVVVESGLLKSRVKSREALLSVGGLRFSLNLDLLPN